MGLFDWLFGGGSKPESAPAQQPEPTVVAKAAVTNIQPEAVDAAAESVELNPEIVAAIAAGINCVMDTGARTELLAAVTAAVIHHGGGIPAVRIKPARSMWALAGRQALMESRQFV